MILKQSQIYEYASVEWKNHIHMKLSFRRTYVLHTQEFDILAKKGFRCTFLFYQSYFKCGVTDLTNKN